MLKHVGPLAKDIWSWFRRRSLFVQLLLVFPVTCAVVLTVLAGNMGLALMGTAVALSAPLVGWLCGLIALVLAKTGLVIAKDKKTTREPKRTLP
ncbi:hypothetical protein [Rhizobium sp. PL01]|uniref:hypothetical protein n=1 Tax=Rhizobium sp. PL01 TaxID=3085631 RepID=UPI0029812B5B|nr:hypothetical protein [Rhizobium sp. PL01]MDW5317139.1 hypothetical protein [Rhizobium sp. PL01]